MIPYRIGPEEPISPVIEHRPYTSKHNDIQVGPPFSVPKHIPG